MLNNISYILKKVPGVRLLVKIFRYAGRLRVLDKNNLYSYQEVDYLRKTFTQLEIDCVFDVGANSGQYALSLRKLVGYKGLIISFEPILERVEDLLEKSKNDPLWHIVPYALGDKSRFCEILIMENDVFSSLKAPNNEEVDFFVESNRIKKKQAVEIKNLAEVFNDLYKRYSFGNPFLKMDVQGSEADVIQGAVPIIGEFRAIQSELSFKKIYHDSLNYHEIIKLLEKYNFELSALTPNTRGHFPVLVEMDGIFFQKSFLNR
jgi:FkbM family methyltransferase